jgi:hypothetical protein
VDFLFEVYIMTDDIKTIRAPHTKQRPYFSMNRNSAQDDRLSWEARGVLAYLLSKPDDWQVQIKDLQQHCGRDKVRSILNELQEFNYLEVEQVHDKLGKFARNQFRIHETPFTEKPLTAEPLTANPPLTYNRKKQNTEKDSPAPKSAEPAPRNEMYDAIHAVWKYTAGRNGQLAKMLQGTSTHKDYKQYNLTTPITPDQLKQWAAWYRRTELKGSPDLNMVESPLKIQSSITYWQETVLPRRQANITPLSSSHDLNVQQPVTPMLIARRKEMQHG